jgi:hypothetical protein
VGATELNVTVYSDVGGSPDAGSVLATGSFAQPKSHGVVAVLDGLDPVTGSGEQLRTGSRIGGLQVLVLVYDDLRPDPREVDALENLEISAFGIHQQEIHLAESVAPQGVLHGHALNVLFDEVSLDVRNELAVAQHDVLVEGAELVVPRGQAIGVLAQPVELPGPRRAVHRLVLEVESFDAAVVLLELREEIIHRLEEDALPAMLPDHLVKMVVGLAVMGADLHERHGVARAGETLQVFAFEARGRVAAV